MVKYFEKIWLVTQSWFGSGNLCGVNKSCKIVIEIFWKSIAAAWHKLMHKQWRAVGVALTFITSILPRKTCELTSCPRAEQIPCICFKLLGHWPCLEVVCLWYVSGIASLSLYLSSCMGIFELVLVMFFHNQDCYLIQALCFGFDLRMW